MTPEVTTRLTLRKEIVMLVVEDDPGHYLLISHCLRQAGVQNEIIHFNDGQAALDYMFDESRPSNDARKFIMLLDIRMPGIDGVEVLQQLKQDKRTADMPVIMLTTSQDRELARRCYDLGCAAHVVKPPGDVLIRAIQRVNERY